MSGIGNKHGKVVCKIADIYREINEAVVCTVGAAILFCVLPLLRILR